MNGTYTELTFDSRDERRALEEGARECLKGSGKGSGLGEAGVKTKYTDILLTCVQCIVSIQRK